MIKPILQAMFLSRVRYVPVTESVCAQLQKYNIALALLHFGSLTGIAALSTSKWPVWVTRSASSWQPLDGSSTASCADTACRIVVEHEVAFKVHVEDLVVAFHLPAVLSHAWAALEPYIAYRNLTSTPSRVPHRWLEYSVSASIMMVCIMILTGTTDIWTLALGFTCCAATQAMGYVGEYDPSSWLYFKIGCFLMLGPWVTVYYTFYDSLARAVTSPPTFVYYVVWSLFILFMCFAVVDACHRQGRIGPIATEKWYMLLSLVAKTALAWQIFYGALVREKNDLVAYRPSG